MDSVERPRRVLAVLECRPSDDAVRARAVEAAAAAGGWLTLVAVVPAPFPCFGGAYHTPRASAGELRAEAQTALARAVSLIPPDVPLIAAVDDGSAPDVIRRRVEAAAHDLVFARRRRLRRRLRPLPVPVLAVAG